MEAPAAPDPALGALASTVLEAPPPAPLPTELVFVDLETTGCNAAQHRIIEIGIVRMRDGVRIEEWSSLIDPECPIGAATEGFTGISDAMVAGAPRFRDLAPLVREKLGLAGRSRDHAPVFVAHNARFDYGFLRAEFRRLGEPFSARVLCTVKLSRRLFPEHVSHSLDALMDRHGLSCEARHRALGDAQLLADVWLRLAQQVAPEMLAATVQGLLQAHRLPMHLGEGLEEELPEGPGVYRFYGEDEVLLYVGRSRTLRTRILSHFPASEGAGPGADLARAVRRIEWEETAGELGAALRELDWIERGRPIRNRRPRAGGGVTLRLGTPGAVDSDAVEIVALEELEAAEIERSFGLFQSPADAERALRSIAAAQGLCLKRLGLESADGSCIGYQLGRCRGACAGRESPALHAARVQMALAALKLKRWPFPGRIALCERDALGNCEMHVLDRWMYLGTARSEEELEALRAQAPLPPFDPHRYRILARYLAQHPRLEWRDLGAARVH